LVEGVLDVARPLAELAEQMVADLALLGSGLAEALSATASTVAMVPTVLSSRRSWVSSMPSSMPVSREEISTMKCSWAA
jgi:biopolymer transport protein ExbB/TolQ